MQIESKAFWGPKVQIIHVGCDMDRLSHPLLHKMLPCRWCGSIWLGVWICVRPCAGVKVVTMTPLITAILTLLRHTPPKILAPLRVPNCPPCSTSFSAPSLFFCFASSPVLGRTGTYRLWTDHLATLIWKLCLGRKARYLCEKSSPKNVCWASGWKLLQCLLQDL